MTYLKTYKSHVGGVTQGSKLVDVDQTFGGSLLVVHCEVAESLYRVQIFTLARQLTQQNLQQH